MAQSFRVTRSTGIDRHALTREQAAKNKKTNPIKTEEDKPTPEVIDEKDFIIMEK